MADTTSKVYSPEKEHSFHFICKRWPMLRIRHKAKVLPHEVEEYIGFQKTAAGGLFITNDEALAKTIRNQDAFFSGQLDEEIVDSNNIPDGIWEITHDQAGKLLSRAPAEGSAVVQGAIGTLPQRKPDPVAPAEEAPAEPVAARGPRRNK